MSSRQPADDTAPQTAADAAVAEAKLALDGSAGELELVHEPDCDPYNSTGRFCAKDILSANDA